MFGKPSQNQEELDILLGHLKIKPRKVIVEIGVHLGNSLNVWSKELNPHLMIGIEPDEIDIKIKNLTLVRGLSQSTVIYDTVVDLLGEKQIDFLFIDGDHRYESVKRDFELYAPLVRKGGIIAIHDVYLEGDQWVNLVETKKFWDEIRGDYDHTTIHREGGTGTGVLFL